MGGEGGGGGRGGPNLRFDVLKTHVCDALKVKEEAFQKLVAGEQRSVNWEAAHASCIAF